MAPLRFIFPRAKATTAPRPANATGLGTKPPISIKSPINNYLPTYGNIARFRRFPRPATKGPPDRDSRDFRAGGPGIQALSHGGRPSPPFRPSAYFRSFNTVSMARPAANNSVFISTFGVPLMLII